MRRNTAVSLQTQNMMHHNSNDSLCQGVFAHKNSIGWCVVRQEVQLSREPCEEQRHWTNKLPLCQGYGVNPRNILT